MGFKDSEKKTILMIDMETLDRHTKTSAVLAIGLVFGNVQGEIIHEVEFNLPLTEQLALGRTTDPETIAWWQDDEEKEAKFAKYMRDAILCPLALYEVMNAIRDEINVQRMAGTDVVAYANSPRFDISLLESLCEDGEVEMPFTYKAEACFRTMKRLAHNNGYQEEDVTSHSAVEDAVNQFYQLIAYHKHLDLAI